MVAELPVPATEPARAREAVGEILARPEYADAGPSLVQRVWQWVAEVLGRVLQGLAGSGRASLIGTIVLLVAMAVVVVGLLRFGRGLRRDPGAPLQRRRHAPSAEEWRAEAEAHARAGRWREALRSSYRGLVAELAAAGLIEEVPGRTSGEYLTLVRARVPAAGDAFGTATGLFELAWYGMAPVGRQQLERFDDAATSVSAAAGQPAGRAA